MIQETFPTGLLQCNCTVLADEQTREAIVIDPGGASVGSSGGVFGADLQYLLAVIAQHRLVVKQILVTHAHIDHIAGALALKQLTGAPISYNQNDLPLVAMMDVQAGWFGMETPETAPPDFDGVDGLTLGVAGLTGTLLHTPGHTPGSLCLYLPAGELLLAGDTLFAGSVGRTDLPGGDMATLLRSIHHKLLVLPDETRVIPGHGPATTIGAERETNPFL